MWVQGHGRAKTESLHSQNNAYWCLLLFAGLHDCCFEVCGKLTCSGKGKSRALFKASLVAGVRIILALGVTSVCILTVSAEHADDWLEGSTPDVVHCFLRYMTGLGGVSHHAITCSHA